MPNLRSATSTSLSQYRAADSDFAEALFAARFFYIFRQIGLEHETARSGEYPRSRTISLRFYFDALARAVRSFPRTYRELCFARRSFSHCLILFISVFA